MSTTSSLRTGMVILSILIACMHWSVVQHVAGKAGTIARVATRTKTVTKTRTKSRTPTKSPTKSRTRTRTATKKPATASATVQLTPTNTEQPSATLTETTTATNVATPTKNSTFTATPVPSATLTASKTVTSTATPTQISTITPTATRTLTPSQTPNPDRAHNTIVNGGFEGLGGWIANSSFVITSGIGAVNPRSGSNMMATNGTAFEIFQTVTVPYSAPYLRFSYRIVGSSNSCGSFSGDSIDVFVTTGSMSEQYIEVCDTVGWETRTLDLSNDGGNRREIIIDVMTPSGGTVYLDDIGFVSGPTREVDYY